MKTDYGPIADDRTTRRLAEFVVGTRYEDLPADVIHQVRRCTIDCVGVALGAHDEPSLLILREVTALLGGSPQATAWFTGTRTSVAHAAQYNGHLAHVLDFDDTYLSDLTTIHIYAIVVPAAMAVAEWKGASGSDYARAMALGYEVMARVALSAGKTFHRTRWHVSASIGTFGAAAAAGSLLGLNADQMTHALGTVGAQGALLEVMGTMAKGLQMGRASMNGVVAALLAERGFTGAKDIFAGKFGFHAVFQSDRNIEALVGDLGSRWEIRNAGLKAYACGIGMHAFLAAVINLRDRHGVRPDHVEEIEVVCNPQVLVPTGNRTPVTGLEGKFSAYHSAAVAYLDGAVGPAQFTDARVADAAVIRLRERVKLTPDESIRRDEARVNIRMRDGGVLTDHVAHAPGTVEAPLSDDHVGRKFMSMAEPILGPDRSARLLDGLWRLDHLPDLS